MKKTPFSKAEISDALTRMTGLENQLGNVLGHLTKEAAKFEAVYNQSLSALEDAAARKTAEPIFRKDMDGKLANLRKSSAELRWNVLRELNDEKASLDLAKEHFGNVLNLALSYGVGTAERSRCLRELEGLGPVQLQTMARTAEATGNKHLAAAIVTELGKLPAKDRAVDITKLAESFWAEEQRDVLEYIGNAEFIVDRALAQNANFEGVKPKAVDRIEHGLRHGETIRRKREGGEEIGQTLPQRAPNPVSGGRSMELLNKMSAALEAGEI